MMTPADCEAALRSSLPGFSFASVVEGSHGWSFWVFEVDGEWVFRFPRTAADAHQLEREFALLPALSTRLPVHIPRYDFRGEWGGMPFGGYRRLEGEPLRHTDTRPDQELARALGELLTALHAFPTEMAASRWREDDPPAAWLRQHRAFQAECAERAFPVLTPRDRIVASELFNRFNSALGKEGAGLALAHCDLGLEHVLCDDGQVTGVIDWSDAAIGDPAIDFAGILGDAGAGWLHLVLEYYDRPTGAHFGERIKYYHAVAPLHDLLYGLQTGDAGIVKDAARKFAARSR